MGGSLFNFEGINFVTPKGFKENNVATGKVKWFNTQKGYGFIIPDSGENDLFVHHSNIEKDGFRALSDGENVEYETSEGTKGPEAIKVRPV